MAGTRRRSRNPRTSGLAAVAVAIAAAGAWAALRDEGCPRGTEGCPCEPSGCLDGSVCLHTWCWRPGSEPESYYYSRSSLEDPNRVRLLVLGLLDRLGFGPGDLAADVGSGRGTLTRELALRTGPTGRVYATDLDAGALGSTRTYVETDFVDAPRAPLETRLVASPRDTGLDDLAEGSLALVLMINSAVFERTGDRAKDLGYLRRFRSLLREGGRLVYHQDWIDEEVLRREELVRLFEDAGFATEVEEVPLPTSMPETTGFRPDGPRGHEVELRRGYLLAFRR